MLAIDIFKEYIFIHKAKLLSAFKNKPSSWNKGTKGNAILVPGFYESFHYLWKIADELNKLGYKIHLIEDFKSTDKVEVASEKIEATVRKINKGEIVLIAHSKGGVVSKYFLDNSKLSTKIKYSISIASPYNGSLLASSGHHNLFELKLGSSLIKNIQSNKTNLKKIYNFYPKFDNHIIPNSSMVLPGAKNKMIDVNCHTRILESDLLIESILNIVDS